MHELTEMDIGRHNAQWSLASSIMCVLANCNRDKKKRAKPFQPKDFRMNHWTEGKQQASDNRLDSIGMIAPLIKQSIGDRISLNR